MFVEFQVILMYVMAMGSLVGVGSLYQSSPTFPVGSLGGEDTHMAPLRIGHGLVMDNGPQVGDPWSILT